MEYKDYYQTLGVARTATEAEIKKAFRKLAREHHPDVVPDKDKAAAEEKFKEINEAYEVLGDPEQRQKYDTLGANWQQGGGGDPAYGQAAHPGWRQAAAGGGAGPQGGYQDQEFHFDGTGFSDFFEQYFGGSRGRYGFPSGADAYEQATGAGADPRGTQPRPGRDIEGDLLVTLEEAMQGTMRQLSLQTMDPLTGQAETHSFTVRIPAGASEGRRIRVPGKGAPGRHGGPAGDLFLRVRLAAHPEFRVKESDLYHDLDLPAWDAVLGTEIIVPGLNGNQVKMKIPAGTQNGQQLRLKGRGLPKGRSGESGDLYVVVQVQTPEKVSAAEKELWEKLAQLGRADVSPSSAA